jgi:hypothetical protein
VDVLEHDACQKLARWFDDRWDDQFCLDISRELIAVIEESWAREQPLTPYEVYLKMAEHLALEARAGLGEFSLPPELGNRLFEFQAAAVKIAAHHMNRPPRPGSMATGLAGRFRPIWGTTASSTAGLGRAAVFRR